MAKKTIAIIIVLLLVLGVAYYLISPLFIVVEKHEASPLDVQVEQPQVVQIQDDVESQDSSNVVVEQAEQIPEPQVSLVSEAQFQPSGHHVAGSALLIDQDGSLILRFEDFETDNGPNLHIYLSSDLGATDFVDLGAIKATKGNVNYDVPADVDLEKYNKVLVWCVPFGVLFSYADLS